MKQHLRQWLSRRILAYHESAARERTKREYTRLQEELAAFGLGSVVHPPFYISGRKSVSIGQNVHVASNCFIRGVGGLTIGDNTHVSRNLVLYTVNHEYHGHRLPYDERLVAKPVTIGSNVWVGMNVCIAPGTKIGDGAIVGIGTTVFGEVPAGAIIGNPPWRILSHRDALHYEELERARQYGGRDGTAFLQLDDG